MCIRDRFGTIGFDGMSSNLYHEHRPTQVKKIAESYSIAPVIAKANTIQSYRFRGFQITPEQDYLESRKVVLTNSDCNIILAAPRPIALASTIDLEGNVNLSPFSFFNVFSANPPVLIFSPARRGRNNTTKHTYENARETKEVVINTVNYDIVEQMSLSSTEYDIGVNEFVKSGR